MDYAPRAERDFLDKNAEIDEYRSSARAVNVQRKRRNPRRVLTLTKPVVGQESYVSEGIGVSMHVHQCIFLKVDM